MTTQKGFAPILMLLLIGIALVAAGGAYYFGFDHGWEKSVKLPTSQTTPIPVPATADETASPLPLTITTVLEKHQTQLLSSSGVVGVGIGHCQNKLCIRVFVKTADQSTVAQIPESLDGYQVEILETGEFQILK